jgi:GNAT superfamily N-acetyltransferase
MGSAIDPSCSTDIADRIRLNAVGIDDWSEVRALHTAALRRLSGIDPNSAEALRLRDLIYSPEYVEDRSSDNLTAAWIDQQLIGTCGWRPSSDSGASARITGLYVNPLFARLGIGQLLVVNAEQRAAQAGFRVFTSRMPPSTVGFFEHLGYHVTSQGIFTLGPGLEVPMAYVRKEHTRVPDQAEITGTPATLAESSLSLEDR